MVTDILASSVRSTANYSTPLRHSDGMAWSS
jgi:hypothetical protein